MKNDSQINKLIVYHVVYVILTLNAIRLNKRSGNIQIFPEVILDGRAAILHTNAGWLFLWLGHAQAVSRNGV